MMRFALPGASHRQVTFKSGTSGVLELRPDSGHWVESYEVFGPGYHARADATQGAVVWEANRLQPLYIRPPDQPAFVATGTYAETVAFIESVAGQRPRGPGPEEVLASSEALLHLEPAKI